MPRKCSIIGCRGKYDKRKHADNDDDDNACSVFSFPRDAVRLKEWLRKIPQDNLTSDKISDYMGVCERHFDSRYIVRNHTFRKTDGSVYSTPRNVPVLSDDAIPTLFANTPSYLSTVPPPKRRNPDDRRAEASARDDELFQDWVADDSISSYGLFQSSVQSRSMELGSDWMLVSTCKYDYVLFVNIESSSSCCPIIRCSYSSIGLFSAILNFLSFLNGIDLLELIEGFGAKTI